MYDLLVVTRSNFFVLASVLMVFAARGAFPQEGAQILDRQLPHDVDITEAPNQIMWDVLHDTGLSGGIVLMDDCIDTAVSPIRWNARQEWTFRQVLDDFQSAHPIYRWRLRGNALDLAPADGIPDLLATKVKSFDLQTTDQQTSVSLALQRLRDLPEIRQAAIALNLKDGPYQGGPMTAWDSSRGQKPPPTPRPISVQVKGVSLQDALNALAEAYGHTMWIYRQRACGGEVTYTIDESQTK